jgi:hypothetical protein
MVIPFSTQVTLAKSIVSLSESCEGKVEELNDLLEICRAMSECADDDHSIAYDLLEYIQESVKIAEGDGDRVWRQQLLETLQDDMLDDTV